MSDFLSRFSFNAVKFNWQVAVCMGLIWLALVACAVSSLFTRPWNKRQRVFWILWIICVPGIGLLSYLPFSLNTSRPTAVFSRKQKKHRK